MHKENKFIIIVAGGSGTRMGTNIPKQFLLLHQKPVLMHTIEVFFNYNKDIKIIVVLPESQIEYWQLLCCEHNFKIHHTVVKGGDTRFQSVKNGLSKVDASEGLVGIHDGVRPLVNIETIDKAFETASIHGTAIPVIKVNESLRKIDNYNSEMVNREDYRLVQTPQCFQISIIKNAYNQEYKVEFTDDASVVESSGKKIYLTDGNLENIKITSPIDLKIAELLITMK